MALPEPHPDRRPGSDSALLAFYDLVPVAEELDLVEDAERERERLWWDRVLGDLVSPENVLIEEPVEADADDGRTEELNDAQVIGLLEHVLGAKRLHDEH